MITGATLSFRSSICNSFQFDLNILIILSCTDPSRWGSRIVSPNSRQCDRPRQCCPDINPIVPYCVNPKWLTHWGLMADIFRPNWTVFIARPLPELMTTNHSLKQTPVKIELNYKHVSSKNFMPLKMLAAERQPLCPDLCDFIRRGRPRSTLVQVMAGRLFDVKASPETMLKYYWSAPRNTHRSVKSWS